MWSLRQHLVASLVFSIVLVYAAPLDVAGFDDALHNIDGELTPAKWPTTSVAAPKNLPDIEATGVAEAEMPTALDALHAHTVAPVGAPPVAVELFYPPRPSQHIQHLPSVDSPPSPKERLQVSFGAPGEAIPVDPNQFRKGTGGGSITAPPSARDNVNTSWTWSGVSTVILVFSIVLCGAVIGWVCENFRIDL